MKYINQSMSYMCVSITSHYTSKMVSLPEVRTFAPPARELDSSGIRSRLSKTHLITCHISYKSLTHEECGQHVKNSLKYLKQINKGGF